MRSKLALVFFLLAPGLFDPGGALAQWNAYFNPTQTTPVLTTGTCAGSAPTLNAATITTPTGGYEGIVTGTYTSAVCAGGTEILTALPTAPHGWNCIAQDLTTTADAFTPKSSTTTSFTFNPATAAASDLIQVQCEGF